MTIYKVCRCEEDGSAWSMNAPEPFRRCYWRDGQGVPQGAGLCFDSRAHAFGWATKGYVVLEVECDEVAPVARLAHAWRWAIEAFRAYNLEPEFTVTAPPGTVLAYALRPLAVVHGRLLGVTP